VTPNERNLLYFTAVLAMSNAILIQTERPFTLWNDIAVLALAVGSLVIGVKWLREMLKGRA
jgi:hypothetical protein